MHNLATCTMHSASHKAPLKSLLHTWNNAFYVVWLSKPDYKALGPAKLPLSSCPSKPPLSSCPCQAALVKLPLPIPQLHLQVEDKMQLLRAALERKDKAYTRTDAVSRLASLLGLDPSSGKVTMCIGQAALLHDDLEAAQLICLQLIQQDYVSAWRLCADVMRAGGDEVGSVETHTQLLSFAAHYCPGRRVGSLIRTPSFTILLCNAAPCHRLVPR